MMKKLILCVILTFTFLMGNSQDFNSDFNNLFSNLPIRDSIEDVINGKFQYSFVLKKEMSFSSGKVKNVQAFLTIIPSHLMFKTPAVLTIYKINFTDSTSKYDLEMVLVFSNKVDQVHSFKMLIDQFDRYSIKTKSSEKLERKNISQEGILEFDSDEGPIKLTISGDVKSKQKEFLLSIKSTYLF